VHLSIMVYGQKDFKPGYLVTTSEDTLYGMINVISNSQNGKNCEFILGTDQVHKGFSPYEIKAYRTEDKYYVSRDITIDNKKEKIFLEFLVDGIVDLYYLKDGVNEYYFIERDTALIPLSNNEIEYIREGDGLRTNDKKYQGNSNHYKGTLTYVFQDSPGINRKISATPFEYRSLINLTKDYHYSVCTDYDCIDYTRSTKRIVYLEPSVGMISTWMSLKTSDDHAHNLRPSFGIMMRIKPLKSLTSWNFLMGLNLSDNDLEGDFENDLYYYSSTKTYHLVMKYGVLRIPFSVEYTMSKGKFQPYVALTYNNIFLLNAEYAAYKVVNDRYFLDLVTLQKYQMGFALGVGLKYNVKNESYFFLKNEFEYRLPSNNMQHVLDYCKYKSLMVNIGYGFHL